MEPAARDQLQSRLDTRVKDRYPDARTQRVALLLYGDDPQAEPGDLIIRVFVDEAKEDPPLGDSGSETTRGLGPADLEMLDGLIAARIATSRGAGIRWALALLRERPAYARLGERARELQDLRTVF